MPEQMSGTLSREKVEMIRADFPILGEKINGYDLAYLDNAATVQKPQCVIDAVVNYYTKSNSNVHRGVHHLSQKATGIFEEARNQVRDFIGATSTEEIIFTKGTTDSINLLAHSIGMAFVHEDDEILITEMEHHSNFVPWQVMASARKAQFKVVRMEENGDLDLDKVISMMTDKTKVLAVTHASNTLGTIVDVQRLCHAAHEKGIMVAVDGAQYIPHRKVDVTALDCDFYSFSAHKVFGPTGIGVLYGKKHLLEQLPPYQTGGGMISEVGLESTSYTMPPQVFEAGTPHIAGAVGMAEAMRYVEKIGYDAMESLEGELLDLATEKLLTIEGLRIIGTAKDKAPVISFVIEGVHPFDLGSLLDQMGIAVRTGHHCTQPIMDRYGIPGTVRASFAFYNTAEEIERLYNGIVKSIKLLS